MVWPLSDMDKGVLTYSPLKASYADTIMMPKACPELPTLSSVTSPTEMTSASVASSSQPTSSPWMNPESR